MRMKWVSGSASPIHCAQCGMPRNGNSEARQQDIRQEEEERHLHRLQLVLGDGGEGVADGEVGGGEQRRQRR